MGAIWSKLAVWEAPKFWLRRRVEWWRVRMEDVLDLTISLAESPERPADVAN